MPEGTLWDTLIRLQAFKKIFIFRPRMDLFQSGKSVLFVQK